METIFKGKLVTKDDILTALGQFDDQYPDSNSYEGWLQNGTYMYALEYRGRLYPCKYILSQATKVDTSDFNGGDQTLRVFRQLGFQCYRKITGGES